MEKSSSLTEMKKKLLSLAKQKKLRPHNSRTKLGKLLCRLTGKFYSSYDKKFDDEIRQLAPFWFCNKEKKKSILLELAKNKEPRPTSKDASLFHALRNYTNPKSQAYDENFNREIRFLVPEWFMGQGDRKIYFEKIRAERKTKLLELAKNGSEHPINVDKKLAVSLFNYTMKSSKYFDQDFNASIRELRPDWFMRKQSRAAAENKNKLLAMAKNDEIRPTYVFDLGRFLVYYTNKSTNSYDADFDAKIRKLRPDWFCRVEIERKNKKNQLLDLAKAGGEKPQSGHHPLARALESFTTKSKKSYDKEFDREIRKLVPHWFYSSRQIKKMQLLELAKKNGQKPVSGKHPLASALKTYTDKESKSYDKNLHEEIRKICPFWF
jgi:hypothetical protein